MSEFSTKLLKFYKKHGRDLPWRHDITPYKVYLSEIMLQQTTVATVTPYFHAFLEKFPRIEDLAQADLEDVYHLWQGLGYYSRARNLHKCAQVIVQQYGGTFPQDEATLLSLPGIGPYTAAAIASIAFNEKAAVVDGNVERVISRLFNIHEPLPKSKNLIKQKAQELLPDQDFRAYSSAIMDFGATVCTPRTPKCDDLCPIKSLCQAKQAGTEQTLPKKEPKKAKKVAHGSAFILEDASGKFYLEKRPETGLLANLWQFPNLGWDGALDPPHHLSAHIDDAEMIGTIRHIFTHIDLTLDIYHLKLTEPQKSWIQREEFPPLSTLMKKVLSTLDAKRS